MSGNYAGYYGEVVSEKDVEIYNKIIEIEEKNPIAFRVIDEKSIDGYNQLTEEQLDLFYTIENRNSYVKYILAHACNLFKESILWLADDIPNSVDAEYR